MRRFASTCILSFTAVAAAQAADLPSRKAPVLSPAPVATWEGFYAGSLFGFGQARFTSSQSVSGTQTGTGGSMGPVAGYNFQNGAWIYGLEGDLAFNTMHKNVPAITGLVAHEARLLDSAHLRARAGYDLGNLLPYLAAGVTVAQGSVRVGEKGAVKTQTGFNAGAGVDWRVQLPIVGWSVLRAEYVYDRFAKSNYTYDPAQAAIGLRPDAHLIRFGFISRPNDLNWRAPNFDADWSGGYAGVIGGYANANLQTKTASASEKLNADGGLAGVYGGRNFVFGRTVLGFESSTMIASLKGDGKVPGTTDALSARGYYETTVRGRAGYAFGRFLPFFAAGMSTSRSEQTDRVTLAKRTHVTNNAWNIGAGLDYMLTERISTRVEYLHAKSWKDANLDLNGTAMRQSRSSDMVRAGFAWHFH